MAKSKLASGTGNFFGIAMDERELDAMLKLKPPRSIKLRLRVIDADNPCAAPRQP